MELTNNLSPIPNALTANPQASRLQTARTDEENARLFATIVENSRVEDTEGSLSTQEALAAQVTDSKATEDQFLTLLLAQMNNQDPLNPLENSEVTTQLAQISTVSGIEDLNKTMTELLGRTQNNNPVDGAVMIDRQVLVSGDRLELTSENEQKVYAGARLNGDSSAVLAEIYGRDGEAVRTINLGPQAAGLVTFEWDGLDQEGNSLDAGEYRMQVVGQTEAGPQVAAPLVASTVTGVTSNADVLNYRLANGTTIAADKVLCVF